VNSSRIKELREKKGWNQKELSEQLGVSQGAVSSWENGRSRPRSAQLAKLQALFGLDDSAKAPTTKKKITKTKPQKKSAKAAKPTNGHKELLDQLFQAAVKLRGSIEAPDYKRFVLPMIFLRFLSLRYKKRRDELLAMVNDPSSQLHTTDADDIDYILNDADEYKSANVFIVPEKSRWDYLRNNAQADDIKTILDDALEELEKTYPKKLRGLLPRIFAGSNLTNDSAAGLINLFSKGVFSDEHGGLDMIGRVYEYFIGEFADSEGKRGGEYFTPLSIVRTLIAMLAPEKGVVFDPCCGSGGMFVQADEYTKHNRQLSFLGQEAKEFTYRLCRMNLFIHGLDGDVRPGNSYTNDQHASRRADYIIANPPFNDGSKGEEGWGAKNILDKDPRLTINGDKMTLSPRNANTMWIMHFLYHLAEGGTAGFVMASGELSSSETHRQEVRKHLVEGGYVDCIVQLTGQLFANTPIPCALWFLSKNRIGAGGYRKRDKEILFIDGRNLGKLIQGSRKQKELSLEEIDRIAAVYEEYRAKGTPDELPGFCRAASIDEIREHDYVLTPGRYVGAEDEEDDGEPFEEKMERLAKTFCRQSMEAQQLTDQINSIFKDLGYAT
jgi:type I restriction enzyme M protein